MLPDTLDESLVTLRFGVVSALDEDTGRVRCTLPDYDGLETYWLPVLHAKTHADKHWSLPDVGEQVALLLDARGESGVVLGAIYGLRDAPPVASADKTHVRYSDGTTIDYDRAAHALTVQCVGQVTVIAAGPVLVQAPSVTLDAPQTTCTGKLTVNGLLTYHGGMAGSGGSGGAAASIHGDVVVSGSISASGSIMDAGGNSNHHTH